MFHSCFINTCWLARKVLYLQKQAAIPLNVKLNVFKVMKMISQNKTTVWFATNEDNEFLMNFVFGL